MKTEFCYSDELRLTVYDIDGESWDWGRPIEDLNEALTLAQTVLDGASAFLADTVEQIFITSGNTGEIIAICHPEDWEPEDDEDEDCECDEDCEECDLSDCIYYPY